MMGAKFIQVPCPRFGAASLLQTILAAGKPLPVLEEAHSPWLRSGVAEPLLVGGADGSWQGLSPIVE